VSAISILKREMEKAIETLGAKELLFSVEWKGGIYGY